MNKDIESYFDNIAGYNQTKEELYSIVAILRESEKVKKYALSIPKGLILYGEPGLGKTTLANDLIAASGRYAVIFRKGSSHNKFSAELKLAFADAKNHQPSIVLLDDMDKFSNSDDDHKNTDEYVTIQSCIDSVKNDDVFVIATANGIRCFPSSLIRAGRFDRRIQIPYPSVAESTEIIRRYISKTKICGDIDSKSIAKIMCHESCAALETIVNEAGIRAISKGLDKIDMQCMIDACLTVFYHSPEGKDYLTSKDARTFAVHEAGHAVLQELLLPDSVALVSTRINGGSEQGITIIDNEGYSNSEESCVHLIMCSLAGRAAVEIVFGVVDVGSDNDISKAVYLAERAVCEWGINGITKGTNSCSDMSTHLLNEIDIEVNSLLRKCYMDAKRILIEHRNMIENISNELLSKGTLLGSDVKRILKDSASEV